MRCCIKEQLEFGEVEVREIKLNPRSRDEIPKTLFGLQEIYKNIEIRNKVFSILKEMIPSNISLTNGREGMSFWNILVLGCIRLICNADYDKLHEYANDHRKIMQMLGRSVFEIKDYPLQTIKDNVRLFTPEILNRINTLLAEFGREVMGIPVSEAIHARCDSFHIPTDIHFPTDISLLFDALRKIIILLLNLSGDFDISGWRQGKHLLKKLKKLYRKSQKIKHSTSKDAKKKKTQRKLLREIYKLYLDLASSLIDRAQNNLKDLDGSDDPSLSASVLQIEKFINHAERQIDQITRRILKDEKIPHPEKVFSIFEEHTEWLCKGKAGVSQVLGLNVCIITDQYGFVLDHKVMQNETDSAIAVEIVKNAQAKFPNIKSCSFDKGFHSPINQKELAKILENVYLPKKGKLSEVRKAIEYSEDFRYACKKHSSVEASIACLVNHGLDICPDHGIIGFKRYVGLAIVARNIHHIGCIIQQKKLRELQKSERKRRKLLHQNKKAA
ncbi:MAG: ISNCY family transposase [Candidatus Cloacimonetes bacterium]|nr:ISNCY family transposase [Candidatus Cloacimonadota bacterium]